MIISPLLIRGMRVLVYSHLDDVVVHSSSGVPIRSEFHSLDIRRGRNEIKQDRLKKTGRGSMKFKNISEVIL